MLGFETSNQRLAREIDAATDKANYLATLRKGDLIKLARRYNILETVQTGADPSRNRRTKRKDELATEILAAASKG